jgi:glycosyltransferase involved in cell wall biosynthesis
LITFAEGSARTPAALEAMRALGIETRVVPLPRWRAVGRTVTRVFSRRPLEIEYYRDRRFQRFVDQAVDEMNPDAIVCFFLRTAQYAISHARIPRMLVAEDARVLLQSRATDELPVSPQWFMRWIEREKLLRYESPTMERFDAVTFVSPIDRDLVLARNPRVRAQIVSNGVDLARLPYSGGHAARRGLVFAGKLDVLHNRDMAIRLAQEIYPVLRAILPDVTLTIVGATPPRDVRALASDGVRVVGTVPDLAPFISSAALFVHPQRIGAGIQNKLLEAMALGTPIVTTPIGASGIALRDGVEAAICSDMGEFVRRTIDLMSDPAGRERLALGARSLVEQHYTWSQVYRSFDAALGVAIAHHRSAAGTGEESRAQRHRPGASRW